MSSYLPTGVTNIASPNATSISKPAGMSDALARAKEIAARLTGKPIAHSESNQTDNLINGEQSNADAFAYADIAPKNLKTTIEFIVPGYKVGLIIGTRGETLKRIEKVSDTRITFDELTTSNPADMPERRVFITGLPEDCETSKKMVLDKIEEPDRFGSAATSTALHGGASFTPSSDPMVILNQMPVFKDVFGNPLPSVHFMIPNSKVGLIIGRGGETIRELQERSGAKVFIAPDSTTVPGQQERLISISGNDDAVGTAKTLIEEILEGLKSSLTTVPDLSNRQNLILTVPDNMVGLIIGRKGDHFKLMIQQSHARITIEPPTSTGSLTRTITIAGSPESIAIAQSMIHEKLSTSCYLENNIYHALPGNTVGQFQMGQQSYQMPGADPYSNYFAASTGAGPTSSVISPDVHYTKEQIDYYYAYYYDYYTKTAHLESDAAIQAALAAMTAAGIPLPMADNNSESVNPNEPVQIQNPQESSLSQESNNDFKKTDVILNPNDDTPHVKDFFSDIPPSSSTHKLEKRELASQTRADSPVSFADSSESGSRRRRPRPSSRSRSPDSTESSSRRDKNSRDRGEDRDRAREYSKDSYDRDSDRDRDRDRDRGSGRRDRHSDHGSSSREYRHSDRRETNSRSSRR